MENRSNNLQKGNSFKDQFLDLPDQEIVNILRMRDHYQPDAAKAAIEEAIKRGIITNEDELSDERFKVQKLPRYPFFPIGRTTKQNLSILNNLCLLMYGLSLIPLGLAFLEIGNRHYIWMTCLIIFFLLIVMTTYRMKRSRQPFLGMILLALNVPTMGYAIYSLSQKGFPTVMDSVATALVVFVILYATISINVVAGELRRNKNEKNEQ